MIVGGEGPERGNLRKKSELLFLETPCRPNSSSSGLLFFLSLYQSPLTVLLASPSFLETRPVSKLQPVGPHINTALLFFPRLSPSQHTHSHINSLSLSLRPNIFDSLLPRPSTLDYFIYLDSPSLRLLPLDIFSMLHFLRSATERSSAVLSAGPSPVIYHISRPSRLYPVIDQKKPF